MCRVFLCRLREEEERRLAEEAERNASKIAEEAERQRKRQEFNKALHLEEETRVQQSSAPGGRDKSSTKLCTWRKRQEFNKALHLEEETRVQQSSTPGGSTSQVQSWAHQCLYVLIHANDAHARTESFRHETARQRIETLPDLTK